MTELFSQEFKNNVWAKHAAELSFTALPFREEDVLDALRQYAVRPDAIRALNVQSEAITAVAGHRSSRPREDLLVSADDHSLEQYVDRIEKIVDGAEWTAMYYGLYAASPIMWDVAKRFSDQLASSIGYRPGGRVDIDCFIGRYSSTYIGIHVDHAHNFAFTLRDGKTMFTWPGSRSDLIGKKWPDYDPFKAEGTPLANRTDRVAYFPEDSLHVAETKRDVSINVNIALWETGNDTQQMIEYVKSSLPTKNKTRHDIRSSGLTSHNQDNAFLLSALKSVATNGALERRMLISQLISDTSGRLNIGRPPVEKTEIDPVIALAPAATLQWVPMLEAGDILVAANGHCASFPYDTEIIDLLGNLADANKVDISPLTDPSGRSKTSQLLNVVSALAEWGAV